MNNRNIPFKNKTQQPAENKIPLPDNTVTCDICNNPFRLNQNTLKEETVTLEKDYWKQEVLVRDTRLLLMILLHYRFSKSSENVCLDAFSITEELGLFRRN